MGEIEDFLCRTFSGDLWLGIGLFTVAYRWSGMAPQGLLRGAVWDAISVGLSGGILYAAYLKWISKQCT